MVYTMYTLPYTVENSLHNRIFWKYRQTSIALFLDPMLLSTSPDFLSNMLHVVNAINMDQVNFLNLVQFS